MRRISSLTILLLLIITCDIARADDKKWYVPDHVISQTAGYVGFASIGAGYYLTKRWETDLLFGYAPPSVAGQDTYQISWKNSIHVLGMKKNRKFRYSPVNMGITAIYGLDDDLYIVLSDKYPRRYYPPTAIHLALNLGMEFQYLRHGFFIEVSASDTGIEAYINNPDYLSVGDITTLAFGYKFLI